MYCLLVTIVVIASGVSSVPVPQQYNDQQQYRTPVPILKHNYQQLHGGYQYRSVLKKNCNFRMC